MAYKVQNKVGSPRLHLLNILRENWVYSEFPKEWFIKVIDWAWYYFSQELLDNDFDFSKCIYWKIWNDFMEITWYSRPKINTYIEKHWRVVYLTEWYYNIEVFKTFLKTHIREQIEKRWRPVNK